MIGKDLFMSRMVRYMLMSIRIKERKADIHTKCDNDFYGEPDMPISENLEVEFVPGRDTWN